MKKSPLAVVTLLTVAIGLSQSAIAQTTNTWIGGNTTNNWLTGANWSTGVSPNETNATIAFTSASSTAWTNATNIVGTILASGGNVVIGNTTASASNGLVLATSSGQPVISNSSSVFMYTDLQGTNGFTKIGSGDLTFRFNTRSLTYTGDINLLGGQLSVNQASSLGNANNRLLVGSNATFAVANGANTGTYNFESARTFVVSNGVTFSIRTSTNAIAAVFSNSLVESGTSGARIDFQAIASSSTNEATAFKYTLAGTSNHWAGRTTIQLGAKLTLAAGTVISTNELNFSAGSGTWSGINLGGNTQSIGTLTLEGSASAARTFVMSNGVLRVTNPTAAFAFSGANGTLVDASNSTGFVFAGATANRNFVVRPDVTAGVNTTNTMILATTGAGSNSISAADIIVGTASGTIGGTNHTAALVLGITNSLHANQLLIGGFNGGGAVRYAGSLSSADTVLRGSNGTVAMGNLIIGDTSSGVRPGSGVLDLSAGNIDAVIATNFIIGRHVANANNSEASSFSMGGGSLSAASLQMSVKTGTGAPTMTDTFTQGGGTVTISNITMGSDAGAGAAAVLLPTYALNGGTLFTTNIAAGGGAFSASSSRTLQLSNGGILRNISGSNLAVSGTNSTTGGRMNIALAGNGTVEADSGRTVTFGENTRLSGAGNLTKTGAGTLILSSGIASTNTGALNVSNGVVNLAGSGVAAAGAVSSVAVATNATLLVSQSNQVNDAATVSLSGGTISRGSGVSETFGALTLTSGSTLDFGTGSTGELRFGVYTPTLLLTVQNFGEGNALRFGSDISSSLPSGGALANSYFSFDNAFSYDSSSFTITAIPEPSTYLAAAGLIGLMLWPARRRLLRDAKSILALRSGRRA